METTFVDIRPIAISLFGERWQDPLAGALGVDERTVRRWLTRERPVPEGVRRELADMVRARIDRLNSQLEELVRSIGKVVVYRYEAFDPSTGMAKQSTRMATREGIELIRAKLIEGTRAEIDPSRLDPYSMPGFTGKDFVP